MKYFNFKSYKFSSITKYFNLLIYNFFKFFKFIDLRRYDLKRVYKYLDFRRINFYKLSNKLNLKNFKPIPIGFVLILIFIVFTYALTPIFFNYDKSKIAKYICKEKNIICTIEGKVNYSFYPTPRIKIKDLIIKDSSKKMQLIKAKNVAIKLSIANLINKKKQNYKKIELYNYEINLNLKNLKKYKDIFNNNVIFIPIEFSKGKIIFFDGKKYIVSINDANLNLRHLNDSIKATLKGKFLNDNLYVNLESEKIDSDLSTNILFKMSNFNLLVKANLLSSKNNNSVNGNALIKKDKNKITAIFDYDGQSFLISKSNLRNAFADGEIEGKITILPYFNFDLDMNLSSFNFTKLYNYFLFLDKKERKKIFKINNKINGKLNFSSEKVYSKYNLVNSVESRLIFNNGNISIEQLLISLGKLGAVDVLGKINNDKKFSNFKFESNIFVDNQKKFLSKFGIYGKKNISPNLFLSGSFDLDNTRLTFYEINDENKLNEEDVNYVEKEFNYIMLDDGYNSLFNFQRFKEFIKSINSD